MLDAEIKPASPNMLKLNLKGNQEAAGKFIQDLKILIGDGPETDGILKGKVSTFAQIVLDFLAGNQILDESGIRKLISTFGRFNFLFY